MPPYFHEGFEDFVELVVPVLQERGLFRAEYEGATLRDHLGLARPANPFFASSCGAHPHRPSPVRALLDPDRPQGYADDRRQRMSTGILAKSRMR
ncbi:hypothetical protein XH88_03535 [Bradyrhizobium sp. CCBAU 51627]|nr:hypothetical protein [Bradyrhizobium sp. CCBAU 51627]